MPFESVAFLALMLHLVVAFVPLQKSIKGQRRNLKYLFQLKPFMPWNDSTCVAS